MQTITPQPIPANKLRIAMFCAWAMWRLCNIRDGCTQIGINLAEPIGMLQEALGGCEPWFSCDFVATGTRRPHRTAQETRNGQYMAAE